MAPKPTLLTLHDPPSGTATLDVVLIHGLGGHITDTWTWRPQGGGSASTAVCWPKQLLPVARPLTRVLSFGYNADMRKNTSVAGIRDLARTLLGRLRSRRPDEDAERPIVFVGHCLGGFMVKQALVFANAENYYRSIADSTCGILFFGTPHTGTTMEQLRAIAERFAPLGQTAENGAWAGLTKATVADSSDVKEISEDFCRLAKRYTIASWYETESWPGTDRPIVDPASARMEIDYELRLAVEADHVAMCQFENADDGTFQEVCDIIQRAVKTGCKGSTKLEVRIDHRPTFSIDGKPISDIFCAYGRDLQPALAVPNRQNTQTTHRTPGGSMQPNVVARAAFEVEYAASASRGDLVRVLQQAGQDAMAALGHGLSALAIEESRGAEDSIPWKGEGAVATEEVVAPGRNGAAGDTSASRLFRPWKSGKGRHGKGKYVQK